MQAADAQLQRPEIELSKDETPTPSLLKLPAELQKTVVEYVSMKLFGLKYSLLTCTADLPPIGYATRLRGIERAACSNAAISLPTCPSSRWRAI